VGGATVKRCPEDDDISVRVRRRVVQVTTRHPQEGDVRSELRAVTSHRVVLVGVVLIGVVLIGVLLISAILVSWEDVD
jgi:hypothetical protein